MASNQIQRVAQHAATTTRRRPTYQHRLVRTVRCCCHHHLHHCGRLRCRCHTGPPAAPLAAMPGRRRTPQRHPPAARHSRAAARQTVGAAAPAAAAGALRLPHQRRRNGRPGNPLPSCWRCSKMSLMKTTLGRPVPLLGGRMGGRRMGACRCPTQRHAGLRRLRLTNPRRLHRQPHSAPASALRPSPCPRRNHYLHPHRPVAMARRLQQLHYPRSTCADSGAFATFFCSGLERGSACTACRFRCRGAGNVAILGRALSPDDCKRTVLVAQPLP